jgi:hypothetical protein
MLKIFATDFLKYVSQNYEDMSCRSPTLTNKFNSEVHTFGEVFDKYLKKRELDGTE